MFLSVTHLFNVLIFLDLTIAILCCILLLKVPLKYGVKFALIPLIIFTTFALLAKGEDLLGRPYAMIPKGKFEFIDYRVTIQEGVKEIELWVVQDKKSRLIIMPYSESNEQELAKAKSRKRQGSREKGEFRGKKQIDEGGGFDLSIESVPIDQILIPKEAPEEDVGPTPEELRDRRNKLSII